MVINRGQGGKHPGQEVEDLAAGDDHVFRLPVVREIVLLEHGLPIREASQSVPCGPDELYRTFVDEWMHLGPLPCHVHSKTRRSRCQADDGSTPLFTAAQGGHRGVVGLLIANGANVNNKNNLGGTPLLTATLNGHKDVAEMLIEEGADVNARANNGYTSLGIAEAKDFSSIVKLLKKHGAKK